MIVAFAGGLLNPVLVPAHVLALCALGLLIGQQPPFRQIALLTAFAGSLISGIIIIVAAYVVRDADLGLLAVAALGGVAVATAHPRSLVAAVPLTLIAGAALPLDSVPQEISMLKSFLALAGTAVAALLLVGLLGLMVARLRRDWQRLGMRIAGSWIAASAILVLALRLAR
jgi:hypothetical protein